MKTLFILSAIALVCYSQSATYMNQMNQGVAPAQTTRAANACSNGYYWTTQSCMPCQQVSNGYCTCTQYAACTQVSCDTGYVSVTVNATAQCLALPTGCLTYGLTTASDAFICYSCALNYSLVGGICIQNNNCSSLTTTNALCQTCAAGFYYNWNLQYTTSGSTTSTNTYQTYFTNFTGFCSPCQVASCATCSSSTTCTTCMPGTFWVPSTSTTSLTSVSTAGAGTCTVCTTNCSNCSSAITCTTCQNGYYLVAGTSTTQPTCVVCSSAITNCSTCQNAQTCQTCQVGYYLLNNTCIACAYPCTQCSAANVCTACTATTLLDTTAHTCNPCPANCTQCAFLSGTTGTISCKACADTFFMTATTSGGQVTCQSCSSAGSNWSRCQGVLENTQLTATVPTQCINGYYLITATASGSTTATTTCVTAVNNNACLTLSTNLNTSCQTCITGFALYTNACISCPPQSSAGVTLTTGCSTCAASTTTPATILCTACYSGYYFTAATATAASTCTACTSGCQTCTSTGCQTCLPTYYANGTSCTQCGSGCTTCSSTTVCSVCNAGFFLQTTTTGTTSTGICYACQPNCTTCTSPGNQCTACSSNYVLQNGGCVPLTQANCYMTNATGCQQCVYGFYMVSNQCLQCVQPYAGYVCRDNQTAPSNGGTDNGGSNGTTPTTTGAYIQVAIIAVLLLIQ